MMVMPVFVTMPMMMVAMAVSMTVIVMVVVGMSHDGGLPLSCG